MGADSDFDFSGTSEYEVNDQGLPANYNENTGQFDKGSERKSYREPEEEFPHDTVRKAFDREKLKSPEDVRGLEVYVQTAKRNGTSIQNAIRDYAQMEDTMRVDPVTGVKSILTRLGYNPQAVAQHLYNGTSPIGDANEAQAAVVQRDIGEFLHANRNQTEVVEQLKPGVIDILNRNDKRLGDQRGVSNHELLDRAF